MRFGKGEMKDDHVVYLAGLCIRTVGSKDIAIYPTSYMRCQQLTNKLLFTLHYAMPMPPTI
jgi:tartrate dehydratase beta subunit/fumarate hydratase class I family protein